MQQRWLTMRGICDLLQTHREHIDWLVANGYLEKLPGKRNVGDRYLEPTEAYAERLRFCEAIYRRRVKLPSEIDIDSKAIFTVSEIAEILGWKLSYARKYLHAKKVPCVKIGGGKHGGIKLYSSQSVREMVWRKYGRKTTAQKAPFLIPEMVELYMRSQESIDAVWPTDDQFADDEILGRKLRTLAKAPIQRRQAMLADFVSRYKQVAQVVDLVRNLDSANGARESSGA